MEERTTISISKRVREELEKLKKHPRETPEDVVKSLIIKAVSRLGRKVNPFKEDENKDK